MYKLEPMLRNQFSRLHCIHLCSHVFTFTFSLASFPLPHLITIQCVKCTEKDTFHMSQLVPLWFPQKFVRHFSSVRHCAETTGLFLPERGTFVANLKRYFFHDAGFQGTMEHVYPWSL